MLNSKYIWLSAIVTVAIAAGPAEGQVLAPGKVTFHGFGGWSIGDTDGNAYLGGEDGREYDHFGFALAVHADVSDRLAVSAQLFSRSEGEELRTEPDYAFATWKATDTLSLRGGLVKLPFGIYTELYEVGTLRPFFDLPQGIYGPGEFVAKSFLGLSVSGTVKVGGWDLDYDAFGGEVDLDSTEFANPLLSGSADPTADLVREEKLKDVLGGRLRLHTPVSGLSLAVSAYRGQSEPADGAMDDSETQESFGGSIEYSGNAWQVRSEYVHRRGGDDQVQADAAYLELARELGEHWQIAARWDRANREEGGGIGELIPSLDEHRDVAVSINYWLSSNLVLKLSAHRVTGNLYAIPPEGERDPVALDEETRLLQLGIQFSF